MIKRKVKATNRVVNQDYLDNRANDFEVLA